MSSRSTPPPDPYSTANLSDYALLQRVADQDRLAISQLRTRYLSLISTTVASVLAGQSGDVKAVTEEAFYRIVTRAGSFDNSRPSGTAHGWIKTIATRQALNQRRSNTRHPVDLCENMDDQVDSDRRSPEEEVLEAEQARKVRIALNRLSKRERSVLMLRYYEDLSSKDIAAIIESSIDAVNGLLKRAEQKLRLHELELKRYVAAAVALGVISSWTPEASASAKRPMRQLTYKAVGATIAALLTTVMFIAGFRRIESRIAPDTRAHPSREHTSGVSHRSAQNHVIPHHEDPSPLVDQDARAGTSIRRAAAQTASDRAWRSFVNRRVDVPINRIFFAMVHYELVGEHGVRVVEDPRDSDTAQTFCEGIRAERDILLRCLDHEDGWSALLVGWITPTGEPRGNYYRIMGDQVRAHGTWQPRGRCSALVLPAPSKRRRVGRL